MIYIVFGFLLILSTTKGSNMRVYIESKDKTIRTKARTVKELLSKLKINPVTVIVARNNELVTEDARLNEGDEIKIISVVSGG